MSSIVHITFLVSYYYYTRAQFDICFSQLGTLRFELSRKSIIFATAYIINSPSFKFTNDPFFTALKRRKSANVGQREKTWKRVHEELPRSVDVIPPAEVGKSTACRRLSRVSVSYRHEKQVRGGGLTRELLSAYRPSSRKRGTRFINFFLP